MGVDMAERDVVEGVERDAVNGHERVIAHSQQALGAVARFLGVQMRSKHRGRVRHARLGPGVLDFFGQLLGRPYDFVHHLPFEIGRGELAVALMGEQGATSDPGQRGHEQRPRRGIDAAQIRRPGDRYAIDLELMEDVDRRRPVYGVREIVIAGEQKDWDVVLDQLEHPAGE